MDLSSSRPGPQPGILAIGTANPPNRYTQEQIYDLASKYSEFYRNPRIRQIFLNSDIDFRHLYLDIPPFARPFVCILRGYNIYSHESKLSQRGDRPMPEKILFIGIPGTICICIIVIELYLGIRKRMKLVVESAALGAATTSEFVFHQRTKIVSLSFEMLAARIGVTPSMFWIATGSGCCSISSAVLISSTVSLETVLTVSILCFCLALTPLITLLCVDILSQWVKNLEQFVLLPKPETNRWFTIQMQKASATRVPVLGGILFCLVAMVGEYGSGLFTLGHWGANLVAATVTACSMFVCGMALVYLKCFAQVIYRVGALPIQVQTHRFGVMSTGSMLVRQLGLITIPCLIYTGASLVRSGPDIYYPYYVAAIPAVALILFSFFACQIGVHQAMLQYKEKKIIEIEESLSKIETKFYAKPSKEIAAQLSAAREEYNRVLDLPEWPFRIRQFASVLGYSFSTLIPPLLAKMIK